MTKGDELLTRKQAAEFFKVHPRTIRTWQMQGKLPVVKVGPAGKPRYLRSDLLALIQEPTAVTA